MKLYELLEDGNIVSNVCCASWPLVQGRPLQKNNTTPLPPLPTVRESCHALPNILLTSAARNIHPITQDQLVGVGRDA